MVVLPGDINGYSSMNVVISQGDINSYRENEKGNISHNKNALLKKTRYSLYNYC